jgi:ribosomal protein S18 acetylase RimI-like enzyme
MESNAPRRPAPSWIPGNRIFAFAFGWVEREEKTASGIDGRGRINGEISSSPERRRRHHERGLGRAEFISKDMTISIREFRSDDANAVNRVALAAWDQYRTVFSDWAQMEIIFANAAALATKSELLVAKNEESIVGCVAYVRPGRDRESMFDSTWSIIRMLSVDPAARGQGIGRRLSEACIERARRDAAPIVGLHTSPVMTVALPMYLRLGFVHYRDIPDRNGLPYAIYSLTL